MEYTATQLSLLYPPQYRRELVQFRKSMWYDKAFFKKVALYSVNKYVNEQLGFIKIKVLDFDFNETIDNVIIANTTPEIDKSVFLNHIKGYIMGIYIFLDEDYEDLFIEYTRDNQITFTLKKEN